MATSPIIKTAIIAIFLMILAALATAFRNLFSSKRENRGSTATVKALTVRVALSIALILVLGVLYKLGLIHPNG